LFPFFFSHEIAEAARIRLEAVRYISSFVLIYIVYWNSCGLFFSLCSVFFSHAAWAVSSEAAARAAWAVSSEAAARIRRLAEVEVVFALPLQECLLFHCKSVCSSTAKVFALPLQKCLLFHCKSVCSSTAKVFTLPLQKCLLFHCKSVCSSTAKVFTLPLQRVRRLHRIDS